MTNASIKNPYLVLFLTGVLVLSLGVFAKAVHAQDDGGYVDTSGDNGGYVDDSGDNGGYVDTSGDNGGYVDTSGDNGGYVDTCDSSCYSDTGYDYNYSTDCGCDTYEDTPTYTEESYSTPSYTSTPMTFSAPSTYYSTPVSAPQQQYIPSAPIVQNVPVAYQQQQQQQQQQAAPVNVTTNTCTNYSCNTTTDISNSGNTTTVIPVQAAPVTYPVQYTFPQTYQNVSCTISASQNSVQNGQYTYLSWQSYGATSATLTNYGNVAPDGSLSVQPYGSMNYVLTVYGQNGQTSTCNTYVTAATVYPSVTLSQIPYTGFDFGTLGDAMYWAMLAVFALAAGYLLVYYKGGMGTFATAMVPARKSHVQAAVTKVEKKVAPAPAVATKIETPAPAKVATLESLPTFTNVRPTTDSMSISNHAGAPRIVISRS